MTIGAKIAACRKRAGMSQEKLANELNISRQAVSRWETGEAVPDTERYSAKPHFPCHDRLFIIGY